MIKRNIEITSKLSYASQLLLVFYAMLGVKVKMHGYRHFMGKEYARWAHAFVKALSRMQKKQNRAIEYHRTS